MFKFFFFNDTATTEIYTLSLHDALPIFAVIDVAGKRDVAVVDRVRIGQLKVSKVGVVNGGGADRGGGDGRGGHRSEEHTSELQSPCNIVCRLLLEKKKIYPKLMRLLLRV